jgi:type IV pilus assembly protein PilW
MKPKKTNKGKHLHGFSLVELLVAMAITAVVMTAVFKIYTTQQNSYLLQEQVAEMQQNGRTAKYVMTKEVRMAGYDPTGLAKAGFITAGGNIIHFTMDITGGDGTITVPGDDITYSIFVDDDAVEKLGRNDGSGNQAVVENIDAVGFAYAYANEDGDIEKDGDNIVWAIDSDPTDTTNQLDVKLDGNGDGIINASDDTNENLEIDENDAGTALASPVDLDRIRAVKIWLLVKTGNPDRNYTSANTYVVGNKIIEPSDGNRRQLLATTIKCRNMAL